MRSLLDLGNDQKSNITRRKNQEAEYYGDSIELMQADLSVALVLVPQAELRTGLSGGSFPIKHKLLSPSFVPYIPYIHSAQDLFPDSDLSYICM